MLICNDFADNAEGEGELKSVLKQPHLCLFYCFAFAAFKSAKDSDTDYNRSER